MRPSATCSAIRAPHRSFCRVGDNPRIDRLRQLRRRRLSQQPVKHLELVSEETVESGTVLHRVTAAEPPRSLSPTTPAKLS